MKYLRQTVLVWLLLLMLLFPAIARADMDGTRRQQHDDRRCTTIGRIAERHGITEREANRLRRFHCKRSGSIWVSDLFYSA